MWSSIFRFLPFAFAVGGVGFECCVFVIGRRHLLGGEWYFFNNNSLDLCGQAVVALRV